MALTKNVQLRKRETHELTRDEEQTQNIAIGKYTPETDVCNCGKIPRKEHEADRNATQTERVGKGEPRQEGTRNQN